MYNITPNLDEIEKFRKVAPSGPIGMVNLLKFNGEEGVVLFEEYRQLSEQITRKLGFEPRVIYKAGAGPDFSAGDDWDVVAIVIYDHFEDFARLMTDEDYLQRATPIRDRALAKAMLMVSTP